MFSVFLASYSSYCTVHVLSTKNLSLITSIPVASTLVREITFLRNNSLMLIASYSENQILFVDLSSTNNYGSSISSSITVNSPCGLYAVNDSFVYVASWTPLAPVSTLIFTNNTWSLFQLPNTATSSIEKIFQTKVDSCGRLWLGITNLGIRIFDPWGRSLLYEWLVGANVNGFLLLDNYELYVTDFNGNQILHFNPNIEQCTS